MGYESASDELTLWVDTRGFYPADQRLGETPPKALARAVERIRSAANGARYFHLITWPLVLDLDGDLAPSGEEVDEGVAKMAELDALERLALLLDQGVEVLDAGLYRDGNGEAALRQTVRLEKVQACLALINELARAAVLDELGDAPVDGASGVDAGASEALQPFESAASRANLRAFVQRGGTFLSLSEEGLGVHVPMVPSDLAILLKAMALDSQEALARDSTQTDRRFAAAAVALVRALGTVEVSDNVATLRFPAGPDGKIRWAFDGPRGEAAEALAAALTGDTGSALPPREDR